MSFKREIDGYYRWMFSQIITLFCQRDGLPHVDRLGLSISPGIVREGVVVPDPERQYFEFEGGNVFSWSIKDCTDEQKENLYKMVTDNVISGNLAPRQILPSFYHNQILAEAIKGNRNPTLVKYLESVGTKNG